MKTKLLLAAALLPLLIPLSTCASPTNDRVGSNGTQPDGYQDATHVIVYRNADQVPNVAYFCAGGFGWASTLKDTGSSSGSAAPSMVRFPEYDKNCTP